MRFSIGLKIFGIALFVLVLMMVVAFYTTWLAGRVQDQVEVIAQYYLPISNRVADAEVNVLEQEVHLEHLENLYLRDPENSAEMERMRAAFTERGEEGDQHIAEALESVREGLNSDISGLDKVEFARLEPLLEAIEKEHQDFNDLSLRLLEALEQGNDERFSTLSELSIREEEEFDLQLDQLRMELEKFVLASTLSTRDDERSIRMLSIILSSLTALLGLCFAGIVTVGMIRPLKALVSATRKIEEGNLDAEVPITTRDEVGTLSESFNHMVRELRVKERIKDTFGKYLDPRVVVTLIDSPESVIDTTGEKRVMTMFFSDIAGFTPIGEALTPDALVKLINEYFTYQAAPIQQRKGIIDKFIGDSVMAFWEPPFTGEDEHARLACLSALDQREQLEEFRRRLPDLMGMRKGLPDVNFRIGIATGEVVVGNIGSKLSKSYTVMGDTVNLASRLEAANKHYGTRFLISETTQEMVSQDVETREIDLIQVVGKSEPVRVFELLAPTGELEEKGQELRARFHQGIETYRSRDWESATRQFEACLALAGEDPPSRIFLKRVEVLKEDPPPQDWDGVWRFTHK